MHTCICVNTYRNSYTYTHIYTYTYRHMYLFTHTHAHTTIHRSLETTLAATNTPKLLPAGRILWFSHPLSRAVTPTTTATALASTPQAPLRSCAAAASLVHRCFSRTYYILPIYHMYVCVCVHMYIYINTYTYICINTYLYICIHICIYI